MSNLSNVDKQNLDNLARAQQMQINARLTALQAAQSIMSAPGYLGVPGERDGKPIWVHEPGKTDHVTLLAMAGDIENYIMGNIVEETKTAIEAAKAKLNAPRIVRP